MYRYLTPFALFLALAAPALCQTASPEGAAPLADRVDRHPATAARQIDVADLTDRQARALDLALTAGASPALTERAVEAILHGGAFRIETSGATLVIEDDAPLKQLRQTVEYLLRDPDADRLVDAMSDAEVMRRYLDLVT